MSTARAFRGFRFPAEVVLWAVRWYLRFPVSYRDLELMLADRGRRGRPHDHVEAVKISGASSSSRVRVCTASRRRSDGLCFWSAGDRPPDRRRQAA
jgi:transposase-like protein